MQVAALTLPRLFLSLFLTWASEWRLFVQETLQFLEAAQEGGGHRTRASEPGLTTEAGCPRGRLGDRTDPWGGSLVALTLGPGTPFPILPAAGR